MREPREFWIDDFLSDKADFVTCVSRAPKTHFIHVIEKSAYDALLEENKMMREDLEKILNNSVPGGHDQNMARECLAKLKGGA